MAADCLNDSDEKESPMPAIPVKGREWYIKVIEVLDRVGGAWQGVGDEDRYILVSPRQYDALVEAKVVSPEDIKPVKKEAKRGKSSPKRAARS
jgi:hypothetical protein